MLGKNKYARERSRKLNPRLRLLGRPWFLFLLWLVFASAMTFFTNWIVSAIQTFLFWWQANDTGTFIFTGKAPQDNYLLNRIWQTKSLTDYGIFTGNKVLYLVVLMALSSISVKFLLRLYFKNRNTSSNQYGNDRLTTEREVKRQYPQIPDRQEEFKGYGGIPLHHLPMVSQHSTSLQAARIMDWKLPAHGFYAIDPTTINSLIVGITRSGKGETIIMPLIDILSRAEKKSSMVINDPKGELYQMSYETLRKRGYNVQVLNIQKTDFSMSYNPLQIIIDYAKDGYFDEVQQEVNSLSSTIYTDPNAKDKFWQNSSINLLNSLILALIDYAKRNNKWEKVTMDNVVHMMTNLGGQTVYLNAAGIVIPPEEIDQTDPDYAVASQKPKLVVYFEKLAELNRKNYSPFRQMAVDAFAQSKFAGDETSGNIYSGAMEGIKIYLQSNIAKLTSMNSLNFESIGFPRMFKIKLPEIYQFNTAIVTFKDKKGKKIESRTQIIDSIGFLKYAVENTLSDHFQIELDFNFDKNKAEIKKDHIIISGVKRYIRHGLSKSDFEVDPYTGQKLLKDVLLKVKKSNLQGKLEVMKLTYSEAPTALFMVTPPNNPSYNQLPAFAIDQIFNTIYNAALNNGRKSFIRVHFILDEFGQLPTIDHMDTKVSIGLGQNICFNIVVQNLEQLKIHYSDQQAATIESNCANLLYILTESKATAESISKRIGQRTVSVQTQSGQALKTSSVNVSNSFISQDILSPVELMQLQGGEMIVLRSVYRNDQKGKSVSAKPIFDEGSYTMPYRYKFLKREFNDKNTLSDIGIHSPHQGLDLGTLSIDFDQAFYQLEELSGKITPEESGAIRIMNGIDKAIGRSADALKQPTIMPILDEQDLENLQVVRKVSQALVVLSVQAANGASKDTVDAIDDFRKGIMNNAPIWWQDDQRNNWEHVKLILNYDQTLIDTFESQLTDLKSNS